MCLTDASDCDEGVCVVASELVGGHAAIHALVLLLDSFKIQYSNLYILVLVPIAYFILYMDYYVQCCLTSDMQSAVVCYHEVGAAHLHSVSRPRHFRWRHSRRGALKRHVPADLHTLTSRLLQDSCCRCKNEHHPMSFSMISWSSAFYLQLAAARSPLHFRPDSSEHTCTFRNPSLEFP